LRKVLDLGLKEIVFPLLLICPLKETA